MRSFKKKIVHCLYAALLSISAGVSACKAEPAAQPVAQPAAQPVAQQSTQSGLKTVDNPGGGQFVYGPLTGQSDKTAALVYMLHLVHTHFAEKPVVGKLLQSRDGNSLATFFTVNAQAQGNKPIAGLVIISMPDKGSPQAAVLYDDAKNFASSEPAMMKSLTAAWQGSLGGASGPASANNQTATSAPSSATPQLFTATGGDRSAMIKMPKTWKLDAVSGGALMAEGDRGEMVFMGIIYQNIINPQSPMGQRLISGPMASGGAKVVCPITSNLFTNYVCVFNQTRRNNGKAQGKFNFIGAQQQGGAQGSVPPIVARFTVDFNDGMGVRNGSAYLAFMMPPNPQAASWAMMASMSNIPQKYGSAVDPTLKAVVESYSQNASVIAQEGQADLNRIRAQGLANQQAADAINQRRESSAAANDQHNADIDWQSKINQDYILDRSVIRDTGDTVHATASNSLADALVKSNPSKLEYVPNQQLIRGVDY